MITRALFFALLSLVMSYILGFSREAAIFPMVMSVTLAMTITVLLKRPAP